MKRVIAVVAGVVIIASAIVMLRPTNADEAKPENAYSSQTFDLGVVVSDIDKSAKFYTEAIGFKEVAPFEVGGDYTKDVGLNDGAALKIRVFTLGDDKTASKLKLVQAVGAKSQKGTNEFIDSQYGFRYITIHIHDTNAAVERLTKAGVKTVGKSPLGLPKPLPSDLFLTCVKDPDGNMVELVGPRK